MNTERTEKFVNAIACDLEEGGFRQVSGTTLRRTLATAVSAALPLLADTGIPASQPAELADQQGAGSINTSEGGRRYVADFFARELRRHDFTRYITTTLAADFACVLAQHFAATGKQQVGEVQRDALSVLAQLAQVNRHCHSRFRDYDGPADCAVQAAIAALAAQPSPAGQGAVPCATSASHALRVAYRHLDMVSMRVSHCKDAAIIESAMKDVDTFDLNAAISALAARQPGAQVPVGQVRTRVDGGFIAELFPGVADRVSNMAPLFVVAPAQGIDLEQQRPLIARSLAEWHEDDGNVMWWAWCGRDWAGEPAWCGTPNDSDWPGHHTHWTQHPVRPALIDGKCDSAPGVGNG